MLASMDAGASAEDARAVPGDATPKTAPGQHRRRARREAQAGEPAACRPRVRAGHRVFLHEQGEPVLGPGTFDLLVLVGETGSLRQAAKLMGMSYNKAWCAVRQAEERLRVKLLARRTGGAHGGGAVLTADGVQLVERFRAFLDESDADLARLFQKYFGDAAFAQPIVASRDDGDAWPSGGAGDSSG